MNDLLRKRSFGQLLRSISLTMSNYSPQSTDLSGSKSHFLAMTPIPAQSAVDAVEMVNHPGQW